MNNEEFVGRLKEIRKAQETKLQRAIQIYLYQQKAYCFKVHGSSYMRAGIPDIICCYKGKFIGIECKVGRNKMSEVQKVHQKEIENADGIFILAYSVSDVKKIIEQL